MYSLIFTCFVGSFFKNKNSILPILMERDFEQKIYFCPLKMTSFFKVNPIFLINLEQRLPKSLPLLRVQNPRFLLSYFLKKYEWPHAADSPLGDTDYLKLLDSLVSNRELKITNFENPRCWIEIAKKYCVLKSQKLHRQ